MPAAQFTWSDLDLGHLLRVPKRYANLIEYVTVPAINGLDGEHSLGLGRCMGREQGCDTVVSSTKTITPISGTRVTSTRPGPRWRLEILMMRFETARVIKAARVSSDRDTTANTTIIYVFRRSARPEWKWRLEVPSSRFGSARIMKAARVSSSSWMSHRAPSAWAGKATGAWAGTFTGGTVHGPLIQAWKHTIPRVWL